MGMGKKESYTVHRVNRKQDKLSITYDCIYSDDWSSFKRVFGQERHSVGKANSIGIEGYNCSLLNSIG